MRQMSTRSNNNNDYPLAGIWVTPSTESKTKIIFKEGFYYLESKTGYQKKSKRLIKEYIKHYKMEKSE